MAMVDRYIRLALQIVDKTYLICYNICVSRVVPTNVAMFHYKIVIRFGKAL